jgi:DNA-binding NtrC family response regulator
LGPEIFVKNILVVTQKAGVFDTIESCFVPHCRCESAGSQQEALVKLPDAHPDFVFLDLDLLEDKASETDLRAVFEPFFYAYPALDLIIMASQPMIRKAVQAVKAGARDYVTYPLDKDEVKHVIENVLHAIRLQSELDYFRDKFWRVDSLEIVRTKSARMKAVFEKIRSVSPTRSTVLLMGETGTGKSVMARLIHQHSNRRNAQFISVHCGAIPDTLLESELFGHEKGAFTGAIRKRLGKFEIAKGGTIFLDEIATITPSAQIKLLQILQDGTFQRVGGEATLEANVRVIAATNTDLKGMCETGQFRKDLYYRLNVFPIEIPSLRERIEDISYLCDAFLTRLRKLYGKNIHGIEPSVIEALQRYSWPGNIRELENLVERAYILDTSSILRRESFPNELFEIATNPTTFPKGSGMTLADVRRQGIAEIEQTYLKQLLARNRGKIKDSANEAGISTRQLNKLMTKYDLHKEEFRHLGPAPS